MKIKTFEEWVAAVEKEYSKLYSVQIYLNGEGKTRLEVFQALNELSGLAQSASDMLDLIENCGDAFPISNHITIPWRALERLTKVEKKGAETT